MEAGEKTQGIVIQPSPCHGFRLQQYKLRGPIGSGKLKLPGSQRGLLLTHCQVATLKGLHGMVIGRRGSAGACIFKNNKQQEEKNPSEGGNRGWETAPSVAKPIPDARQT